MYNFLVTFKDDAWNLPAYEYDRDRFGEYTSPGLKDRLKQLTAEVIEELKSYPALFAYEGEQKDVRIGYLRRIKERARSILIEYEFEPNIPPIPFAKLADLRGRLDVEEWEMNRTHWAVKDEDLFGILYAAGLIDETFSNSTGHLGRVEEMNFKVALSFPGETRAYVGEVANELKRRLPWDLYSMTGILLHNSRVRTWTHCSNGFISTIQTLWSSFYLLSTRRRNGVVSSGARSEKSSRIRVTTRSC